MKALERKVKFTHLLLLNGSSNYLEVTVGTDSPLSGDAVKWTELCPRKRMISW